MRTILATDARLERTPDGRVWWDGSHLYQFWERYLDVFDEVRVVARMRDVPRVAPHARTLDGPRVSFFGVPYFHGPVQFAKRYFAVRRAVRAAIAPDDVVLMRAPGTIPFMIADYMASCGRPFGMEVIGDPYDSLAPGSVRSIFRPIARRQHVRKLRWHCAHVTGALYVTARALQRRYPPGPNAYTDNASDVDVRDEAYSAAPRPEKPADGPVRLVYVGGLDQLYKAPDILIKAMAECVRDGLDLNLKLLGAGQYIPELQELARGLGIGERVRFLGGVPAGPAVREQLDQSDVFVLPSRQEGVPRAMIEAMARALPCIGSTIAGIPEILPPEDMVPPNDVQTLAARLREVCTDPKRRACMSARNLQTARQYHASILQARRRKFYGYIRERTREWQRRQAR
ncbi:MAG: glycosyltransferase family 4 protein [Planctomycetota bacterium]